jgi:hypothetical protein
VDLHDVYEYCRAQGLPRPAPTPPPPCEHRYVHCDVPSDLPPGSYDWPVICVACGAVIDGVAGKVVIK